MYTRHAQTRCQQRAIRPEVVDAILEYGCQKRRHGADVYFMDSSSRKRLVPSLVAENTPELSVGWIDI
jgi:hypothetical protein